METRRILDGVRVVNWSYWGVGNIAGTHLAEWGADVVKIEPPNGDPGRGLKAFQGQSYVLAGGRSSGFETWNRGQRSITLNLKTERGKELIYQLVKKADIFIHNFRREDVNALGLDYATLSQHNPRLIYGFSTGQGQRGPEADIPSFDLIGQARSGIMPSSGEDGMPAVPVTTGICDHITGMLLAHGITMALIAREKFGFGQQVEVSQLQAMLSLLPTNINTFLLAGGALRRHKRTAPFNPLYNYYECKGGRWLLLGGLQSDRYWGMFCDALEHPELESDPRFNSLENRASNTGTLFGILQSIFSTRTAQEWVSVLREKTDIPCAVINDVPDLVTDPQVEANNYLPDIDHPVLGKVKMVGLPVNLTVTPASVPRCAPEVGEHTEEVLLEMGYTWDQIIRLKDQSVI